MVSKVYVIGVGMGNPETLTLEAREALEQSELVIGAPRLLTGLDGLTGRQLPLIRSGEIAECLRSSDELIASVVMSGDVGYFSGATTLLPLLDGIDVRVIPGISSLAYLCARLRKPWQDIYSASAHGRACDVAGIVQSQGRSFFLTGGASTVQGLCAQLSERGLGDVRVFVGERLSYPDERIKHGTARELAAMTFDPLAVMLVENDVPLGGGVSSPYLPDDAFLRGNVPMTKEEVRELAVCKLRVRPTDVVWDVGAGTGSVTVELARAAHCGQVFAVEKNEEALKLIQTNCATFGLTNVRVVSGTAPETLSGLAAPDRVFVGGSSGNLEQILRTVVDSNPAVRLCVVSITVETLAEALRCAGELGLADVDVVQVSVARAREVGGRHLMLAQNPVIIVCAEGPAASDSEGGERVP